ncbi:MAG: DUF6519 domain-containing protein, partial [Chloroflexi bacterium]|nr:DUF6519 domain-containing protein [Chloroflexota bacterium]
DQSGTTAAAGGIKVTGDWQPLEDGVEVLFAPGTYRTGDYWLIPARTATAQIEWPPFDPTQTPLALPPIGMRHHFCKLAVVDLQRKRESRDLQLSFVADCRDIFRGLAQPPNAMHVISTNWENDSEFDIRTLALDGLYIYLDAVPDSRSVKSDTVIVTLERPAPQVPFALESLILLGSIETFANVIHWTLNFGQAQREVGNVDTINRDRTFNMAEFSTFARAAAARQDAFRLRVTLKGHVIWAAPLFFRQSTRMENVRLVDAISARTNEANIISTRGPVRGDRGEFTTVSPRGLRYLDGQAFGVPEDKPAPHIGLIFPSGAGVRASDFESWFFVGARQRATPLQVRSVEFHQFVPGQMDRTVATVDQFPPAQALVMLVEDQINRVQITFTRAVNPQENEKIGTPQIARLIFDPPAGGEQRMASEIQISGDTATISLRDPNRLFNTGRYQLTVFASSAQD